MKSGKTLVTTLFALASFSLASSSLFAQQPPPDGQPKSPAATQQTPPGAAPDSPSASQASVELSPVKGELVSKLDSKTAKTGDNVVVQTKTAIKTADGTEIPKGSKLMGHVIAAQPSGSGSNSQVALQFDRIEVKGGQSLPVHSQIQSISPPSGAASAGDAGGMGSSAPPSAPSSAGGAAGAGSPGGSASMPQSTGSAPSAASAQSSGPPAGTIVAKNGNIAISTTSIPGVLLANNAPGQQDPRMAQASSILLGAKQDIHLDNGTQVVVGVAAAGGGAQ